MLSALAYGCSQLFKVHVTFICLQWKPFLYKPVLSGIYFITATGSKAYGVFGESVCAVFILPFFVLDTSYSNFLFTSTAPYSPQPNTFMESTVPH
mgnify:CR=1 FL=1|jgi:hypothetical protein